jgi:hypothetical protein
MIVHRNGKRFRCYIFPQNQSPQEFWAWLQDRINPAKPQYNKSWDEFNYVYHLSEERIVDESDLREAFSTLWCEFNNRPDAKSKKEWGGRK